MEVGRLILDYVRALIWPALAIFVFVCFRPQVAKVI
jgi:hypothetical protein